MSAIRMIAWGTIDADDEANHKFFREEVRRELRQHGMRLIANGNKRFRLIEKSIVSGGAKRRDRRNTKRRIYVGNFKHCCKIAADIIEKRLEKNTGGGA